MKQKTFLIFFMFLFAICQLISCKKEKAGEGSATSVNGGTKSHNVGEACLRCHNPEGSNEYWFFAAGTIYNADSISLYPNCTVYLYSDSTGENLNTIIPVDGKANFYTTSGITFGTGLFPAVKSLSGQIMFMSSSISQGNCNGCHTAGKRIIVN